VIAIGGRLPAVLVGVLVAAGASTDSRAYPLATAVSPEELLTAVSHLRSQRPFSGSVLVMKEGRIFAAHAYGYADRSRHRRARLDTRYRISGLTTAFTWIGLLQLHDRHLLDLDASVCVYLRPCPKSWRPLTPRHLMGPSTGLHALWRADFVQWPPTIAQYVDRLRRDRLYFTPGTLLAYNTSPYFGGESPSILAARLLEIVSGQGWNPYVRQHILRPAGMSSTGFARSSRDAVGYGRGGGQAIVPLRLPAPTVVPAVNDGFWSTVGDMARLHMALLPGKLLSRESLAELNTPAAARDRRRGRGWSCCWLIGTQFGHAAQLHGAHGTADGFYGGFERYPNDGVFVLVLTNFGGNGPAFAVADLASSIALGEYPSGVTVEPAKLARLAGVFQHRERRGTRTFTDRITVAVVRDQLRVSKSSAGVDYLRGVLLPLSDSAFVPRYWPAFRLEFVQGPANEALKVILRNVNAGWQIEFRHLAGTAA
jgi:D-alanyl-D-alanine carboxypeptidase